MCGALCAPFCDSPWHLQQILYLAAVVPDDCEYRLHHLDLVVAGDAARCGAGGWLVHGRILIETYRQKKAQLVRLGHLLHRVRLVIVSLPTWQF